MYCAGMSTCPAYNVRSGSRGPHERRLLCVLRAVARRRGRHLRTRRNAQSGRPDRAIQAECARADSRRQTEGLLHSGAGALFTRSSALLCCLLFSSLPHCSSTIHSHTSRPKTQSGPSLKQWAVAVQYLSTIFFCRRVAARSWTAASRCTTRRRAPTRRTARCAASRQRPTFSWPTRWCRVRAAASFSVLMLRGQTATVTVAVAVAVAIDSDCNVA